MGEVVALNKQEKVDAAKREKIHEGVKKLKRYVGDILSKNQIRELPITQVGDIFWVELDSCAYIVVEKEGKKVTIKKLDETASVSTGISIYDINKMISQEEPNMDISDTEVAARFEKWLKETNNKYYLLYGRAIHYVTLIDMEEYGYNGSIITQLAALIQEIGDIISIDFDTVENEKCIEIWIRIDGSAELLYLICYDKGIERFW